MTRAGRSSASLAAGDLDHDGVPEVVAADLEGKVYVWNASGRRILRREAVRAWSGKPLRPFVDVRKGHRNRTQHGFIASPVLADLDGDGGRLEIIAAGMDRHVYAWNDDGTAVPGFPVLVVDQVEGRGGRTRPTQVTFNQAKPATTSTRGRSSTPRRSATSPATPARDRGRHQRGVQGRQRPTRQRGANVQRASRRALQQSACSGGGQRPPSTRSQRPRLRRSADRIRPTTSRARAVVRLAGEDRRCSQPELLPVVGEGVNGSPIIAPLTCRRAAAGRKVGALPDAGIGYILNPDGASCFGQESGKDNALQSGTERHGQGSTPPGASPAVGQPGVRRPSAGQHVSFLAARHGLTRALDVAANEYQGGQDFLGAWDAAAGSSGPASRATMNDLQFLAGPAVADLDGVPGEEIVNGSASLDIQGFNAAGAPIDAGWPKLSSDWVVATPLIGTFGQRETDGDTTKVVVAITRRGAVPRLRDRAPARARPPPGRASTTTTPTRATTAATPSPGKPERSWRSGALASPRPATTALRHRREVRGRAVRLAHRRRELRFHRRHLRRSRAQRRGRPPGGHAAGEPEALPGRPCGGRAGQPGPHGDHRHPSHIHRGRRGGPGGGAPGSGAPWHDRSTRCLPAKLGVSASRVGPVRLRGSVAALRRRYRATSRRGITTFCARQRPSRGGRGQEGANRPDRHHGQGHSTRQTAPGRRLPRRGIRGAPQTAARAAGGHALPGAAGSSTA